MNVTRRQDDRDRSCSHDKQGHERYNHGYGNCAQNQKDGDGASVGIPNEHVVQRVKVDHAQEHQPSDAEAGSPGQAGPSSLGLGFARRCRRGGNRGRRFLLSLLALLREHRRRLCRRARRGGQPARGGARGQGLRDRQSMGQSRRPAGGTRPPRFRGPSGGGGSGARGGPGGPEVALHRGRRHRNHFHGRSGRGFRRRGGRPGRRGNGPGRRGDGQEPAGAGPGPVGSGPSRSETGGSRPRGRGSTTTAGRHVLETHCGAGSRTCRFPGQPGGSGCRAAGRRRRCFGGAATDHGPRGGRAAGRGRGSGSRKRRSSGRVGCCRATGCLGTGRGPARRAPNPPPSRSRRADRKPLRPRPTWPVPKPRPARPA